MEIKTRNFGKLEIDDSKIINFSEGIPGFDELKKYVMVLDNEDSPFYWLQSIDEPEIAFVMIDVFKYMPVYNPVIEKEVIENLGEYNSEEILIYNIAVIPEDINKMSVNLKAPVVINTRTGKGIQAILNNEDYPIKHYLYEYIQKENKKVGEQ